VQLDPANATTYQQRFTDFNTRWLAAMVKWKAEAAPLRGRKVVVHHVSWVYLWDWLGIQQIGALEPKPSVPPTSAHLASLIATTKAGNTLAIIRAAYQDPKPADWLADRTGVPAVTLPYTVGGDAQSKDLFGLFDSTLAKLLGAAK
jgi:zinc/manganese transport system substrate-binding protein